MLESLIVLQSADQERWSKSPFALVKGQIALDDDSTQLAGEQGETAVAHQDNAPLVQV